MTYVFTDEKGCCLIGHTIQKIRITEDRTALLFITDKGEIIGLTDGDCCSSTWIEDIEMVPLPALVTDTENVLCLNDTDYTDENEVIKFYGYKIYTDQGYILIDYRNSSNGYYGGTIYFPGDLFYNTTYKEADIPLKVWRDVN